MKPQTTLCAYIQQSIRKNWELPALSDFYGATYSYRDVARKIAKLHLLFEHAGLEPGDKIALCGRNSANWAIAAIASLTYGTVAVPIPATTSDGLAGISGQCTACLLSFKPQITHGFQTPVNFHHSLFF